MDCIVNILAKLLLIYSIDQQNNYAVNLISSCGFVTHRLFIVPTELFYFLPLLVLFSVPIFLVPFCHFLQVSLYCNYASLLLKYTFFFFFCTEIQRLGLDEER